MLPIWSMAGLTGGILTHPAAMLICGISVDRRCKARPGAVRVIKTTAHQSKELAIGGQIDVKHFLGNGWADTFAGLGAEKGRLPAAVENRVRKYTDMAGLVLRRLVASSKVALDWAEDHAKRPSDRPPKERASRNTKLKRLIEESRHVFPVPITTLDDVPQDLTCMACHQGPAKRVLYAWLEACPCQRPAMRVT